MNNKLLIIGVGLFLHSYATEDFIEQKQKIYRDAIQNGAFGRIMKSVEKFETIRNIKKSNRNDILKFPRCIKAVQWFTSEEAIKSQWQYWTKDNLQEVYDCCNTLMPLMERLAKDLHEKGSGIKQHSIDYLWHPIIERVPFLKLKEAKEEFRKISKECTCTVDMLKEVKKDATELLYHRDNEQNANN
ncbi:MAG TPA: hypothetical protein VGW78_01205 [Candidatus Babeliales bacterium]|nr:hypothetical protein [Candidatus Babeliales bacterium]